MHVKIVAQSSASGFRIVLVILGQFREFLVRGLVDNCAFFNPADFVLLRLHLEKAAVVLEDFELLTVGDQPYALTYGSNAVMQVGLPGCDVNEVVLLALEALAPRNPDDSKQHTEQARDVQDAT